MANTLRLLKLPDDVKALLGEGRLSAGHARTLITLPDPSAAARRIVDGGLSVRQAEAAGKRKAPERKGADRAPAKDADTLALEKRLSDVLGYAVSVIHGAGGGEVRVRYKSFEQLDDICRRLERAPD